MKTECIYQLKAIKTKYVYQLKALALKKRKYGILFKKNKDGSIDINEHDLGCYTSYETAKEAIKKHLKITKKYVIYGGFIICKIKLNDYDNNVGYIYPSYYGMKTYDSNGNYNSYDYGIMDGGEIYRGGYDGCVKFKEGDVIYRYIYKKFYPQVIISKPTNEKNFEPTYGCDRYLTIGTSGYDHVPLPMAFPFSGKLSKKEKKIMIKEAKSYFGKERFKCDNIDEIFENLKVKKGIQKH